MRVLVVANRTAESDELLDAMKRRADDGGGVSFTLLVPATPHGVAWAADMHSGTAQAKEHTRRALARMRAEGLEVEGRVGDPDPVAAVEDEVNMNGPYDAAIVSTLPTSVSKWLKLDLPNRVRRATGLEVTHVTGSESGVPAG